LVRHLEEDDSYDYNIVIIDTPPTPSVWMTSALLASSHYLIPVKPDPISRTGIDLLTGVVNRMSENYAHNIHCLALVLTMVGMRTRVYRETLQFFDNDENWRSKRTERSLPQRTAIAREQGNQRLILDIADTDAKISLASIAQEVLRRLGYQL
jgi:chromosome partitioning protein